MPRRDEHEDDDLDQRSRSSRDDAQEPDRYQDYDDYDDRPRRRRGGRAAAAQRVTLPAILLMVVGGIGLAFGLLNAVLEAAGMNEGPNPFVPANQPNDPAMKNFQDTMKIIGPILNIAWGVIVLLGGLKMKNLTGRGFVMFSTIFSMLPCNACCILGIPLAIWALIVINDDDVKRAFST